MEVIFETSVGTCKGTIVDDNKVIFSGNSLKRLQSLYNIKYAYVEGKWIKLRLIGEQDDEPEYKIVYID